MVIMISIMIVIMIIIIIMIIMTMTLRCGWTVDDYDHDYHHLKVRMDAVSHLVEDSQLRDEPVSGETDDDLDWRSLSSSLTSRIIFFSYFDWRSLSSSS